MFVWNKDLEKVFFCLFILILVFCSSDLLSIMAKASEVAGTNNPILRGEIWYGNASWYGSRFQGRKTSNGEKFNKRKLTAAHPYLPFDTQVKVTNLKNKKSVVVRINDRGPFIGDRIIDLSEEAAKKIDARKEGISYIKLQVLTPLVQSQNLLEETNHNES